MTEKPILFASYIASERLRVLPMIEALRAHGAKVWLDVDSIQPGANFASQIEEGLKVADAILFFVSEKSQHSQWQMFELTSALIANASVIPIALDPISSLLKTAPDSLRAIHWVDVSVSNQGQMDDAARRIVASTVKRKITDTLSKEQVSEFAENSAIELRDRRPEPSKASNNAVFLVHGHDHNLKDKVIALLVESGIQPIILSEIEGGHRSILQKFMLHAEEARFAIVLISPDDKGASNREFEFAREQTLKFRARQNVILELGFFLRSIGLGECVCPAKAGERPVADVREAF